PRCASRVPRRYGYAHGIRRPVLAIPDRAARGVVARRGARDARRQLALARSGWGRRRHAALSRSLSRVTANAAGVVEGPPHAGRGPGRRAALVPLRSGCRAFSGERDPAVAADV